MSWEEHGMTKYSDYFETKWWQNLKEDHLYKRGAKCYVCSGWANLLLHHVSYANLFKEKLYRDIYVVCFNCHNQVHFWTIFKIKVPLKTNYLLFSMRLRKIIFCIRNKQFGLALLWFFTVIIILIFNASGLLIKETTKLFFRIIYKFLGLALRY